MAPPVVRAYAAGAALAQRVPAPLARLGATAAGAIAASLSADRRRVVERNLARIDPRAEPAGRRREVIETFASYGRYWAESFRLPAVPLDVLDDGLDYEGYEHICRAREQGNGVIIVLPHLGGWEWAAMWLTRIAQVPVTAVVEALEPPELFEWFADLRRDLGMAVVPLGPGAAAAVMGALRDNHVLCLLSDRDITGGGVEVELFGETTTIPAGPATLALRSGAPIVPAAVYFAGHRRCCRLLEPVPAERRGRLRDDVARISGDIATAMETLIREAPTQWHVMQPNWPSDRAALSTNAVSA
ncbi:MAG: phosphatidylinositol mannoside acyltransferase [Actinomycetota bacterium]|nr:phosphatidylinositol mannoside acyltransferase [Actinomycetota bacterium]